MTVIRTCVVEALRLRRRHGIWMKRLIIIDKSTELRAEESVQWVSWADAVSGYVAGHLGASEHGLVPARVSVTLSRPSSSPPSAAGSPPRSPPPGRCACDVFQRWLDGSDRIREILRSGSTAHREVAGHGSGVRRVRDARAGRRRMTPAKIIGHRETSRFVRTSRALTRAVAHVRSVRNLAEDAPDTSRCQRVKRRWRVRWRRRCVHRTTRASENSDRAGRAFG
ncbi:MULTISPECIES: hypothetical protein [Streptomyces]|uniref:acyl-CoA-like ligand-binding transcription factor n=1 Tax=Streptomyces lycopersici TaxID=2974589 RepID=UPI0035252ADD